MKLRHGIAAVLALLLAGCKKELPDLPRQLLPEPAAAEVETVLYLVGDAGNGTLERSPLIRALRADVERWAGLLRRDTAVVVLYLGDNIYPKGLHPADHASYSQDSAYLQSQVHVLAGPNARRWGLGYFMAGNHDWGEARGPDGVDRLQNQEQFLARRAAEGVPVTLEPEAGEPGPALIDIGARLRLLIYDTAWWMLATDQSRKVRVFQQTEDALRSARDRTVVFASHHPYASGSSHGGHVQFWKTVGVRFLLARSGAILQDLNSLPYREFTSSLREAFRVGPPFIWAGGHDHSLQVIRNDELNEPTWALVSGSASKVSRVGHYPGMEYRHAAPGYMKLFFKRDGGIDLLVVAAPSRDYLSCVEEGPALEACMARAAGAFEHTFGKRLR